MNKRFVRTLADKTRNLRDIILKNEGPYISDIQALFRKSLYRDLSQKDFADALAQIFTFSLLFCRLTGHKEISRKDFTDMPDFIPVLKEIMGKFSLDKMPADALYVIDSIIDTINVYDESIFPKDKNYKDNKEDPFIYLYEHFLKEFDPDVRNARGVFYTPIQVVRYLIRSADEILKDRLGTGGLTDSHILDFATGTGTFLLSTIEYVYRDLMQSHNQGLWKSLVKNFILRKLYGFEYLIVPYVLAHFRIYEYLRECDYEYQDKDRLQLYLTNTLDNGVPEPILMFPDLNEEADAARQVKNTQPILVVMGNPPYNSKSDPMNSKEWITELLKDYKEDTDAPLSGTEKGKLEDDYIKFIRFAQWKIDSQPKGLVSVIVNNSFLDGVSHRLMRKSLMSTFDEIYIFNLHGNGNKAEKTPDGDPDANVFPIQSAGVCMLLMAKTGKWGGVYYQDLYAPTAKEKLDYLQGVSWRADRDRWQELHSAAPWYWFVPREDHKKYWHEFKGLKEIFSVYKTGVQFSKDKILVHSTPAHVCEMLQDMHRLTDIELQEKYNFKETKDWKIDDKKRYFLPEDTHHIYKIHYRPFNYRYAYYPPHANKIIARGGDRYGLMCHLLDKDNMGLIFVRYIAADISFEHVLISRNMVDKNVMGHQTYFAPLYLYDMELGRVRRPNWTQGFMDFLCDYHTDDPEEIMGYIYAVLYAPSYRTKYADALSYDFPRVPFTADARIFNELANLGRVLIDLHLMKVMPGSLPSFPVEGDMRVEQIKYEDGRVYINQTQYFDCVDAWDYTIGGYRVLYKWLSDRKGRVLSFDDVQHFQRVAGILKETMGIQGKIDEYREVWDD